MHTIVVAANFIQPTGPSKLILFNEHDIKVPLLTFENFIEAYNSINLNDQQSYKQSYNDSIQFLIGSSEDLKNKSEKKITKKIVANLNYIEPTTSYHRKVEVASSTLITTITEDENKLTEIRGNHKNSSHQNHNFYEDMAGAATSARRSHEYSRKSYKYDDMDGATALPDYWKHLFVKNPTVWICKNCTLENVMTSLSCAACDQPIIREKPYHLREDNEPVNNTQNFNPYFQKEKLKKTSFMDDDNDVVPNREEFLCSICFKTCLPNEGVVLRDCIHSLCKRCIRESIVNNFNPQIKCPYKQDYTCESNLQDREIRGIVGQDIYDEYQARIALEIQKDKNIFNCRNENCIGYGFVDEKQTSMECPVCKTINCILCRDIHNGMNCAEFKKLQIQQKEVNDNKTKVKFTAHYFHCKYCR